MGDGDGPNLFRVKKVDVSFTFIENIFRSGLTLGSSNDIITIKIDKKMLKTTRKKRLYKKNWAVKWTKGKRKQYQLIRVLFQTKQIQKSFLNLWIFFSFIVELKYFRIF